MTPLTFVVFVAVVVTGVAVFDGLDRRQTARDRDAARMARSARNAGVQLDELDRTPNQ